MASLPKDSLLACASTAPPMMLASLAIGLSLRVNSRVFGQAIRNVNDGINALRISEGAVSELSNILIRQKELAEQAANGTYSTTQRQALQSESDQLTEEYNRILQVTKYNNRSLLVGRDSTMTIQAGEGDVTSVDVTIGQGENGSFAGVTTYSGVGRVDAIAVADFNNDGLLDLEVEDSPNSLSYILLGNGDGTFRQGIATSAGGGAGGSSLGRTGDLNGDGNVDIVTNLAGTPSFSVRLGNGDGTMKAPTLYGTGGAGGNGIVLNDFNGDGRLDVAATIYLGSAVSIRYGAGDGTFGSATNYSVSANPAYATDGDLNGDGRTDLIIAHASGIDVGYGNSSGTFQAVQVFSAGTGVNGVATGDVNNDGKKDIVYSPYTGANQVLLGNGNGTFQAAYSVGGNLANLLLRDFDGDGKNDLVSYGSNALNVQWGNGDGTFQTPASYGITNGQGGLGLGDFNSDGFDDLVTGHTGSVSIRLGQFRGIGRLARLNLVSQEGAKQALTYLDQRQSNISLETGRIGVNQSRLSTIQNNLQTGRENYRQAESRIFDIDVAAESALSVQTGILQQTAAAVLAQANQSPALALQLLSG